MLQVRSGPRHFFRLTLIKFILKDTLKKGDILDAGAGDGSLSIQLARAGFNVTALEPDEKWCAVLRGRLVDPDLKERIKVHCSSLENTVFKQGSFDAIICGEVLEHVTNDLEAIENLYALLKKNGSLILTVPLAGKGWDDWDALCGHLKLYDFKHLKAMLVSAGFSIDHALSWGYPFTKFYHRFIFLRWARQVKSEDEILQTRHWLTRLGKSFLVSVMGWLFFIDLFFTPTEKGIGVIVRARK